MFPNASPYDSLGDAYASGQEWRYFTAAPDSTQNTNAREAQGAGRKSREGGVVGGPSALASEAQMVWKGVRGSGWSTVFDFSDGAPITAPSSSASSWAVLICGTQDNVPLGADAGSRISGRSRHALPLFAAPSRLRSSSRGSHTARRGVRAAASRSPSLHRRLLIAHPATPSGSLPACHAGSALFFLFHGRSALGR